MEHGERRAYNRASLAVCIWHCPPQPHPSQSKLGAKDNIMYYLYIIYYIICPGFYLHYFSPGTKYVLNCKGFLRQALNRIGSCAVDSQIYSFRLKLRSDVKFISIKGYNFPPFTGPAGHTWSGFKCGLCTHRHQTPSLGPGKVYQPKSQCCHYFSRTFVVFSAR